MSSFEYFLLLTFAASVAAGLLGALAGLGGGVLIVPLLTIGFDIDIRLAIGTSIVAVIATSSGAGSALVRDGLTNVRIATLLQIATTIGEVVGAIITSEAGLPCEVLNPYGESKVVVTRLDVNESVRTLEGGVIRFDTQAGAKYLLVKEGSQATAGSLIAPDYERGELDHNFYGIKKQPRF